MSIKSPKTLVFIDDSGDAGFSFGRGSSTYFIIAAIIFTDPLEVEKTAVAIKEYRRRIKFPDDTEFKFNKSGKVVRIGFLDTVNKFAFKIRCIVINKTLIRSEELKGHKNSFYSYAIKMLLKYSHESIVDAKIKIDGSGDRVFRKSFATYLRKTLNSSEKKIVSHLAFANSKDNVMIQMADMVAGSIRRSFDEDKSDRSIYKKIIQKHIEDEWNFRQRKRPRRAVPDASPMLVVPATPPSGDSSNDVSLCLYISIRFVNDTTNEPTNRGTICTLVGS